MMICRQAYNLVLSYDPWQHAEAVYKALHAEAVYEAKHALLPRPLSPWSQWH